jgi:hypothetical protein
VPQVYRSVGTCHATSRLSGGSPSPGGCVLGAREAAVGQACPVLLCGTWSRAAREVKVLEERLQPLAESKSQNFQRRASGCRARRLLGSEWCGSFGARQWSMPCAKTRLPGASTAAEQPPLKTGSIAEDARGCQTVLAVTVLHYNSESHMTEDSPTITPTNDRAPTEQVSYHA